MHVDRAGVPIYSRRFASVEPFYNGQARVELEDGALWIIDESGAQITQLRPSRRDPVQHVSSLLTASWSSLAISGVVELGLFEELPGPLNQVSTALNTKADTTLRLLRAMWELGLVEPVSQSNSASPTWNPTANGRLLQRSSPLSLVDAAELWTREHLDAWRALAPALKNGEIPFERVHGAQHFDWYARRPVEQNKLASVMTVYAKHDYGDVANHLDLRQVRSVVDAGGGEGSLLQQVLDAAPDAVGILLDSIAECAHPEHLHPRASPLAADIQRPWPVDSPHDLILIARVLHDWPDDAALQILTHARSVLSQTGRIALVEWVLEDQSPAGSLLDLHMHVQCGGRERTLKQLESLAAKVGLSLAEAPAKLNRWGWLIQFQVSM
jgi:hypothetical protein